MLLSKTIFSTISVLFFEGIFHAIVLLNIQVCHITVLCDYVTIRLPEGKTNVYREGQDVLNTSLEILRALIGCLLFR